MLFIIANFLPLLLKNSNNFSIIKILKNVILYLLQKLCKHPRNSSLLCLIILVSGQNKYSRDLSTFKVPFVSKSNVKHIFLIKMLILTWLKALYDFRTVGSSNWNSRHSNNSLGPLTYLMDVQHFLLVTFTPE